MSITCSIIGCNGKSVSARPTKLYRIPAVPIASSGFIHDLSNNRRRKWMAILEDYGLTEENSASFRVCSNHFTDGKPAPTFDSKNPDWVPHLNLDKNDVKPIISAKRKGRPRRKSITMSPETNKSQSRSKSSSRARTPERLSQSRSKSVSRARKVVTEVQEEKTDSPFVFVDIQKIKEGVSVVDNVQPTSEQIKKMKFRTLRSFGTQTNPNVLPPIKWGRNKSKKIEDTRYRSTGVQASLDKKEEVTEACLGGMIEYIRKEMLDFIFAPFGKDYKLTECALHFERQLTNENGETEKSVVIVQSNKLLSSNWPLLETLAKSLDLHKKEKKKEKTNTGLIRMLSKGRETLEQVPTPRQNSIENRKKPKVANLSVDAAATTSAISPTVTPKITNVISIGDLMKHQSPTENKLKRRNTVSKPQPHLEVKATVTELKNLSMSDQIIHSDNQVTPKKPRISTVDISKQLGTNKVPKIILQKLPDSIIEIARQGKTIPIDMIINAKDMKIKKNNNNLEEKMSPTKVSQLATPIILKLAATTNQVKNSSQLCLTNAVVPPNALKNIPLKLPEKQGVAGYIVVSKSNAGANPCLYVVPGAQMVQDQVKASELVPVIPSVPVTPSSSATTITNTPPVLPVTSTPIAIPKMTLITSPNMTPQSETSPVFYGAGNSLKCPQCATICNDGVEFILHYKNCKGKRTSATLPIKCCKCNNYYPKGQEHSCNEPLPSHVLHCNVCERRFVKCANLANHLKSHPEYALWSHKCPQCPKKFETEKLLQDHVGNCEMLLMSKKTYPCKHCKKVFVLESRLETHMKTAHAMVPPAGRNVKVKCRRCENVFDLKYYRSTHWKLCHPAQETVGQKSTNITKKDEKSAPDKPGICKVISDESTETLKIEEQMESPQNTDKAKRMTGIRSFPIKVDSDDDLGASIEDQLQKMFQDDLQKSKYDQVKLNEDFEEKIAQNEINSESRKRKLSESEKYKDSDDLLEIKVSKIDDETNHNEPLSNGTTNDGIGNEKDAEICLQSTFDMTDCLNEISFEEVEYVE